MSSDKSMFKQHWSCVETLSWKEEVTMNIRLHHQLMGVLESVVMPVAT